MNTKELNKEEFSKRIIDLDGNDSQWNFLGKDPALVVFYASWCPHCKAFLPVLEDVAGDFTGKVDFYKIDIDKERELAGAFGVQSIPTLIFIPMNGNPHMIQGAVPKDDLENMIEETLLAGAQA